MDDGEFSLINIDSVLPKNYISTGKNEIGLIEVRKHSLTMQANSLMKVWFGRKTSP